MLPEKIQSDPVLADLYRYWDSRRTGRVPPLRKHIDPLEMPRHVLPHLLLVELVGPMPRIHYRLVGTAITARYGEDFTGCWLDELAGVNYRDLLERLYRLMRETQRPVYVESLFRLDVETAAETRRLYLPLTGEDGASLALAGQTFPTYPYDSRDFFPMIRGAPGDAGTGMVRHREWLIDPETGAMELCDPAD